MALVQKRLAPRKRNILVILVVAFVGVSAILVIQNFWKPGSTNPSDEGTVDSGNARDLPIYTDLGTGILEDTRLQDLKMPNVKFPITEGTVGRSNPFVEAVNKAETTP